MRQFIFKSIFAISVVIFVLGLIAAEAKQTNAIFSGSTLDIGAAGGSLFSGQKVFVWLSPQAEPPERHQIEMSSGKGLFSGQKVSVRLSPQPNPPDIYKIEMSSGKGLFSGQKVSVWLRPQPEPP
jgi:hypothetical protein